METYGIDQDVNICIIKMTLLVCGDELKMPENDQKVCFLMVLLTFKKMVQDSHGGMYL